MRFNKWQAKSEALQSTRRELLTVLKFPFRVRTPNSSNPLRFDRFLGAVKLQIGQHRPEIKHSGKHVLEFGDPSHRFRLNWMQRKDGSRKPGSRNFKQPQNSDQEQS